MADCSIKIYEVLQVAECEKQYRKELDSLTEELRGVLRDTSMKSMTNTNRMIKSIISELNYLEKSMNSIENILIYNVNYYQTTERRIISDFSLKASLEIDNTKGTFLAGIGLNRRNSLISLTTSIISIYEEVDERLKNISFHNDFSRQGGTTYPSGDNGEFSFNRWNVYGGMGGSLYTKDKYGNDIFNPNIKGEVGATYSWLTTKSDYEILQYGVLSGTTTVETTVLEGDAYAKLQGSLFNKDGEFDPNVSADAKLGITVIGVEGTQELNAFGMENEVSAALSLGLGAHAKAEMDDGVISVEMGAALGIGLDIGVEIDVKGGIEAVVDGIENAGEFVDDFNSAKDGVKSSVVNAWSGFCNSLIN